MSRPVASKRPSSRASACFGPAELTGRSRAHLVEVAEPHCWLHPVAAAAFERLRRAAARAGFDLVPASSYRDFDTQLRIWNEKWTGRRPLYGRDGALLDPTRLTAAERVRAILIWSAAPGASRHHWGTDLDYYDRAALPRGERLRLQPDEYARGGPFEPLAAWLSEHMHRHGFYRPYRTDRGGVSPEPWHLSHGPSAREASRRLRLATLRRAIESAEIEGQAALLKALPVVYRRYVRSVDPPPRR